MNLHLATDTQVEQTYRAVSALAAIYHAASLHEPYCLNKAGMEQILKRYGLEPAKLSEFKISEFYGLFTPPAPAPAPAGAPAPSRMDAGDDQPAAHPAGATPVSGCDCWQCRRFRETRGNNLR